ncbi:MAG TPA: type 2 isopentenyl-diphosphate Delta-isomerase [Anaerolineales bacterium]|nr:type 2 isopentenyl-diphosphate Delta-isomerase [Anaerolineales bacterium]
MSKVTPISSRKADHIRINLEEDVRSDISSGLENYRFIHQALPELNLEDVSTRVSLYNRRLIAPILISSMTGGTEQAATINRRLAIAAQETGVAMGLGSQRAAIEHPELESTFQVRQFAPDIALFANLGAIQLNYSYGIDECRRAVDMIEADGLILHLNPLQEAVQPEGDTRFANLARKIEYICSQLTVPVIVKEVGWGISKQAAQKLLDAGVSAIDVAGAGGTSWSQVEMHRAKDERQANLAATFVDWGIPTAQAILNVKESAPSMTIFASGGLRTGVDIAKCIALGATLGGLASPFLKAAVQSEEKVIQTIQDINREIKICMFAVGAMDMQALHHTELQQV